MIEVSVVGGELVANRKSVLSLRFANTGRGPCVNIVFKLRLPAGVVLMGGSELVDIATIPAGRTRVHEVTVEAARPGRFDLTSANFSYRDELDRSVRVTDFRAGLTVTDAPEPVQIRQPVGRLQVKCETDQIELGAWDVLRIIVVNGTGVPLEDVTTVVEGPFQGNGKAARIAAMGAGVTARFPFHVNAAEGGRHVPVTVRTTYRHPDPNGTIRTRSQEDNLHVVVQSSDRPATAGPQTILYLAASPRDRAPLRSDVEMRKVHQRLQQGKYRDQYRLESRFAAQFDDISQALVDCEPHVLHFSGHGDEDGNLLAEDRYGDSTLITPEGLAGLFGRHRSTLRCVVLNSCYSARLTQAISTQVDHVIGMRDQIDDEAAIEFSVGFYIGLFGGHSVPEAFARGQAHLQAQPAFAPDHRTPIIFPPEKS